MAGLKHYRRASRGPELAALSLGVLGGLTMLGIALSDAFDAGRRGEQRLAELNADQRGSVRDAWQRSRSAELWLAEPELTWVGPLPPAPVDPARARFDPSSVVASLLAESGRLESGDVIAALAATERALDVARTPDERALALVRRVQLLLKAGESAEAVRVWSAEPDALGGRASASGVGLEVLAGLALLAAEPEPAIIAAVAERWSRELQANRLGSVESGTTLGATLDGLRASSSNSNFSNALAAARAAELFEVVEIERESLDSALQWRVLGADLWAVGSEPSEDQSARTGRAARWDPRDVAHELGRRAALAEGFELVNGTDVGTPVELADLPLDLRLAASDPKQMLTREMRPMQLARRGLLALALLLPLIGLALSRALRRERLVVEQERRFIANVSHELRTPIASILMLADNLESGRARERPGAASYPQRILREADRLRRLVGDLLDFSRLERGRAPSLTRAIVDPNEFAQLLEDALQRSVSDASVELEFVSSVQPGAQAFDVDAEALERACANLFENALAHGKATRVRVEVALSQDGWSLCVADDGRGIERSQRARMLRPFERGSESDAPGTGLGLAIVDEIARGHGGMLSLSESRELGGLEARISIPVSREAERSSA